jgi:prevent-host-death family protein
MTAVPKLVPVSELRQGAADVLARVRRSREPVVITQRGRAAAVLVSVENYQEGERQRELLRRIARGEREIAAREGYDLDDVMAAADRILDT